MSSFFIVGGGGKDQLTISLLALHLRLMALMIAGGSSDDCAWKEVRDIVEDGLSQVHAGGHGTVRAGAPEEGHALELAAAGEGISSRWSLLVM